MMKMTLPLTRPAQKHEVRLRHACPAPDDNVDAAYACMCMFRTKAKFLYFQHTELQCIVLEYKCHNHILNSFRNYLKAFTSQLLCSYLGQG